MHVIIEALQALEHVRFDLLVFYYYLTSACSWVEPQKVEEIDEAHRVRAGCNRTNIEPEDEAIRFPFSYVFNEKKQKNRRNRERKCYRFKTK